MNLGNIILVDDDTLAVREAREESRIRRSRNVATRDVLAFRHAGGTVNDRSWYHEGIARGSRSIDRCVARETLYDTGEVLDKAPEVCVEHWETPIDTGGVVMHYYSDGSYVAHC